MEVSCFPVSTKATVELCREGTFEREERCCDDWEFPRFNKSKALEREALETVGPSLDFGCGCCWVDWWPSSRCDLSEAKK